MIAFLSALLLAAVQPADLQVVREADLRVAAIGEKLARDNVALCGETQPRTGLVLHDIRQYEGDARDAARRAFGFAREVSVEGVVPGSPAEGAGIEPDDGLVAIEGEAVDGMSDPNSDQPAHFARMQAVLDRLDALGADGAVAVEVERGGQRRTVALRPERGCLARFQIIDGGVNASSDGRYVQINSAMYDFAQSDAELAAVLAHELAHNVLDHRRRLNAVGVDRGMLGVLGKSAGRIRATEIEADRLSLYLMANAGFDPALAIPFWDRMGAKHGFGIFSDGTHLRRGPRVKMLREELAALERMKVGAGGAVLVPAFARPPFAPLE